MEGVLLIIDDEIDLIKGLQRLIRSFLNVNILISSSSIEALEIVRKNNVDVILSDIKMPEMDGLELLSIIKKDFPNIEVILMTAYGTIDIAVEALKKGAFDFVTKPIDIDRLNHLLKKCFDHQNLIKRNIQLEKKLSENKTYFIGESPALQNILKSLKVIAKSDMTVLITGESGTGKELAARTIHEWSNRKDKEYIVVNCPAIPENLLESELFGYKKGAFTHATSDKKGLIELADGGTLFLDEIGDISTSVQTKLLRFLQEGEIKPVGSNTTKKVDVRIVAATNQDIPKKIEKGLFREDLYYRLNVLHIKMPSLREIRGDIPLIATHFLREFCERNGFKPKMFSPDAMESLVNFPWTGNIRELKNIVERSALFSTDEIIKSQDLKFDHFINAENNSSSSSVMEKKEEFSNSDIFQLSYHDAKDFLVKKFSIDYISKKLKETKGNVTLSAQKSGMERQYFQQLMRKYNIHSEDFKVQ